MSELQISLLTLGIVAVVGILVYNLWQQRRFRRKYTSMFRPEHDDVLSQDSDRAAEHPPASRVEHVLSDAAEDGEVSLDTIEVAPVISSGDMPGLFPDDFTDYVATLSFNGPENAHALTPLWQQRFDFGKTVYACGLNAANGQWEKVIPESLFSYLAFKLSVQLADRSGAISEVRLEDFRNLVRGIADNFQAQAALPDVAAAAKRAKVLDDFCAGVDQMIGLNILPAGERQFPGGEVARVAALHDMVLQADGSFHLFDANGHTLFSLNSHDGLPLQHHTLDKTWVEGLTLLMDVPRVEQPVHHFDKMAVLARQIAMELHANVVDDNHVALGEAGLMLIRKQIASIEEQMLDGKVAPGSAQALRLFS